MVLAEMEAASSTRTLFLSPTIVDLELEASLLLLFSLAFLFSLAPLKTSLGKSATAKVKALKSPTSAAVAAETGSQGCSSVSCSTERCLVKC